MASIGKRGKAAAPAGKLRGIIAANIRTRLHLVFPREYGRSESAAIKLLALKMGTSLSQVQRMVAGENSKIDTIELAAAKLGCSVIDLLRETQEVESAAGVRATTSFREAAQHDRVHEEAVHYSPSRGSHSRPRR